MKINKTLVAMAFTAISILLHFALSAQGGFIPVSDKEGCKVFTTAHPNIRSATWSDSCSNGYATGSGQLKVYQHDTLAYTYIGKLVKGKAIGHGKELIWYNNDRALDTLYAIYKGDFQDGFYQGNGILTNWYQIQTGQFKKGKLNGYGVDSSTGTARLVNKGYFKDGKLKKGVEDFGEVTYNGVFTDSGMTGNVVNATVFGPLGYTFTGFYDGPKKIAKGIQKYKNGNRYEGIVIKAQKQGKGTMHFADSSYMIGTWKDDLFQEGIAYVLLGGKKYSLQYKKGTKIKTGDTGQPGFNKASRQLDSLLAAHFNDVIRDSERDIREFEFNQSATATPLQHIILFSKNDFLYTMYAGNKAISTFRFTPATSGYFTWCMRNSRYISSWDLIPEGTGSFFNLLDSASSKRITTAKGEVLLLQSKQLEAGKKYFLWFAIDKKFRDDNEWGTKFFMSLNLGDEQKSIPELETFFQNILLQ